MSCHKIVERGVKTWETEVERLFLADECGHTKWVSLTAAEMGMDSEECEVPNCLPQESVRRTWRKMWVEQ